MLHHIGGETGYIVNELLGQTAQSHAQKDTQFVDAINTIMVGKKLEHGTTLSRWFNETVSNNTSKKKAPKKKTSKKTPMKRKSSVNKQEITPKRGVRESRSRRAKKNVKYYSSESSESEYEYESSE